jgi:hypothetical protein
MLFGVASVVYFVTFTPYLTGLIGFILSAMICLVIAFVTGTIRVKELASMMRRKNEIVT